MGDAIALYGAGLATILAVIQYREWKKSDQLLWLKLQPEYNFRSPASLDLTVTNVSPYPLYIEFIGIGTTYRSWLTPWKRSLHEAVGLRLTANGQLSKEQAGGVLKPGEIWDLWLANDDREELFGPISLRRGFAWRPCLYVDHSASNHEIKKVLRWSK